MKFLLALVVFALSGFLPAWSASLQFEQKQGYRSAPLTLPSQGKTGFVALPGSSTGIQFTNVLSIKRAAANPNLMNGSGVALGDVDEDGFCDIFLCNLTGKSVLYRNLGNWKFQDVTESSGIVCTNQNTTGAVFADVNGDGHLDLLVTSLGGPNQLFLGDGKGHFTNVTAQSGLIVTRFGVITNRYGSTSMALADIDGNGTLDLYIANYGATSLVRGGGSLSMNAAGQFPGKYRDRLVLVDGILSELGEPDYLFLNDGKGHFKPVDWTDGTFLDEAGKPLAKEPWDQGLSVMFRDMNGDGFPDIYVCNDAFTPDRIWLNDGHGKFRAMSSRGIRKTSYFSMGVDFADINRDGHDDFMVLDMMSRDHALTMTQKSDLHPQPFVVGNLDFQYQVRRNTAYLARGDGTFAEMANYAGLSATEWSWSIIFLDVDLDGWEDVLVSNGFPFDVDDLDTKMRIEKGYRDKKLSMTTPTLPMFPELETANVAYRNNHNLTFEEVGKQWGFDSKRVGNGMALADLDNDGDMDVVINCLNGEALIYRNETIAPRIAVRLKGKSPNTQGIGGRIKVTGGPVEQSQEIIAGGRYMSGDQSMRVFAAGTATTLKIEVRWPNGTLSVVNDAAPNRIYEIEEEGSVAAPVQPIAKTTPTFSDQSSRIAHTDHEEPYNDSEIQPLLPRKLSQLGPGVAWYDLDGDGKEDLIVGTGAGGKIAAYRNLGGGSFEPIAVEGSALKGDTTAILGARFGEKRVLMVGMSNYKTGGKNGGLLEYEFVDGKLKQTRKLDIDGLAVGALALTDLSGNGSLELFVGGRMIAGRYPEPAASKLFVRKGDAWEEDAVNNPLFKGLGLVTGALFADLDGDGYPDLVVSSEWGPVHVFHNEKGKLRETTAELGLDKFIGWWTGIAAADFNGDGKMDLVVGNWGLNSLYTVQSTNKWDLFFGDFNGDGWVQSIEAYQDQPLNKMVPTHDLEVAATVMPWLGQAFPTRHSYAQASIQEILGTRFTGAKKLEANVLATTLFLNRGDHFESVVLPAEAQFAPVYGVTALDADGDGNEDVFLAQNVGYAALYDLRLDAGRGLLLHNEGGRFTAVPGQASGIMLYGEQRGAAAADFDGDGRVDLVVGQNGSSTALLKNETGQPGLRVKILGPPTNRDGLGARLRLRFTDGTTGIWKEVRAGSSYWSQESETLLFGMPKKVKAVEVVWPGGKSAQTDVDEKAHEVLVKAE